MKTVTLLHVIHPGIVGPASDLFAAQPITFATMEIAREFAGAAVAVQVRAVLFRDEQEIPLPAAFVRLPRLERSIADLKPFRRKRKLALIRDILDAGIEDSDADFVIYTNVDIALQPHFYLAAAAIIRQGHDAFVINRRTIPGTYSALADIPLMYAEIGDSHNGYDCFVFRREAAARFKLGRVHVGSAGIGRALLANQVATGGAFREFRDAHLTFHIGDACAWRNEELTDYLRENWNEYLAVFREIEAGRGEFDPAIRSYLLDTGARRFLPDFAAGCLRLGRPASLPS
jgi:hypothetical protein